MTKISATIIGLIVINNADGVNLGSKSLGKASQPLALAQGIDWDKDYEIDDFIMELRKTECGGQDGLECLEFATNEWNAAEQEFIECTSDWANLSGDCVAEYADRKEDLLAVASAMQAWYEADWFGQWWCVTFGGWDCQEALEYYLYLTEEE